jgi:hypothetical protein
MGNSGAAGVLCFCAACAHLQVGLTHGTNIISESVLDNMKYPIRSVEKEALGAGLIGGSIC